MLFHAVVFLWKLVCARRGRGHAQCMFEQRKSLFADQRGQFQAEHGHIGGLLRCSLVCLEAVENVLNRKLTALIAYSVFSLLVVPDVGNTNDLVVCVRVHGFLCGCVSSTLSLCLSFQPDSSLFIGIPIDMFSTCSELVLTLSRAHMHLLTLHQAAGNPQQALEIEMQRGHVSVFFHRFLKKKIFFQRAIEWQSRR